MIARIKTTFETDQEVFWSLINNPASLQFVAKPLLSFKLESGEKFPGQWDTNKYYNVKIYLMNILPLGTHEIKIEKLDRKTGIIQSREKGPLAKLWDHRISITKISDEEIGYLDEVEIKAGLLTLAILLFAKIFYRHRQKRWKKLLMT